MLEKEEVNEMKRLATVISKWLAYAEVPQRTPD